MDGPEEQTSPGPVGTPISRRNFGAIVLGGAAALWLPRGEAGAACGAPERPVKACLFDKVYGSGRFRTVDGPFNPVADLVARIEAGWRNVQEG